MKYKILFLLFLYSIQSAFPKTLNYTVEQEDQLGTVFLSLGQKKLWSKSGKINLFKKQLGQSSKIHPGDKLEIDEGDILFKKNISVNNDRLFIIKKISTLPEYEQLLKNESISENKILQKEVQLKREPPKSTKHSFNFYPGVGFFMASNKETDRQAQTSTFTGIQPMIELKSIYSNDSIGSLSVDLLTKKIIASSKNFPINFDYRLQFVPLWNFTQHFRVALSHSSIAHSYVGKHTTNDISYKLNSSFIGLGFIIPRDQYWFELYFEKAYTGKTISAENTQKASGGFRMDAEAVYPISKKLRLIPGINYYSVKDTSSQYQLNVFETRLNFAREFEF